ncbi:hypothetical protein OJJOAM_000507 [Cupriavidus sp. H18C1]
MKPQAQTRDCYRHFLPITTRWMDNDVYGHVNNVVYYSYFDTVVNRYLIERGVLDIEAGDTIGLVIETQCNYFASLSFPETVVAGLRVARLGNSSVRYEVGLFREGEDSAAAQGTSCMSMSIARRAARSPCRSRCARRWSRCWWRLRIGRSVNVNARRCRTRLSLAPGIGGRAGKRAARRMLQCGCEPEHGFARC